MNLLYIMIIVKYILWKPRHIDIDENIRNQLLENNFTIDELNKENELTTHLGTWFILHGKPDLLKIYSSVVTPFTQYNTLESFEKKNGDMYNSIILDTMKSLDYTPF